jgi:hypothetical protein
MRFLGDNLLWVTGPTELVARPKRQGGRWSTSRLMDDAIGPRGQGHQPTAYAANAARPDATRNPAVCIRVAGLGAIVFYEALIVCTHFFLSS